MPTSRAYDITIQYTEDLMQAFCPKGGTISAALSKTVSESPHPLPETAILLSHAWLCPF